MPEEYFASMSKETQEHTKMLLDKYGESIFTPNYVWRYKDGRRVILSDVSGNPDIVRAYGIDDGEEFFDDFVCFEPIVEGGIT